MSESEIQICDSLRDKKRKTLRKFEVWGFLIFCLFFRGGYQFFSRRRRVAVLPNGQPVFPFGAMVHSGMAVAYRLNPAAVRFPRGGANMRTRWTYLMAIEGWISI
ncbi:ethylene-responsive transcription factor 4 [Striga asiatica]|uniref:Ethylene-responsive transcription factor 4 n=1 Tax=Striga asiatica TaxID=4170 RepID=A0A5A7R8R0_STRAF|nr:ethylene-responsive transcription factor 4 [Striga asiatica]